MIDNLTLIKFLKIYKQTMTFSLIIIFVGLLIYYIISDVTLGSTLVVFGVVTICYAFIRYKRKRSKFF